MNEPDHNCAEIEPLLDAYHDGELSPAERRVVERHLTLCSLCQARLLEIGRLVASLKGLAEVAPGRDIAEDFDALLADRDRRKGRVIRAYVWGSVGIAAACAVVFVAVRGLPGASPGGAVADRQLPVQADHLHQVGKPLSQDKREELAQNRPDSRAGGTAPGESSGRKRRASREEPELASTPAVPAPENKGGQASDLSGQHDWERMLANGIAEPAGPSQMTSRAEKQNSGMTVEVLALSEGEPNAITEAIGLATDEDGLYAIKM